MNFLDRRFLNFSLSVLAIANEPAANPTAGSQYIVGSNPTGAFASASPNQIARYNGSAWSFISPKNGELEVLNLSNGQILSFNGSAWTSVASIPGNSSSDSSSIDYVTVVKGIVRVFDAENDNVLNSAYFGNIILTADWGDMLYTPFWDSSYDRWDPVDGDVFLSLLDKKIYTYHEDTQHFSTQDVAVGQIFFNSDTHDSAFYLANGVADNVDSITPLGSVLSIKPVDYIVDSFVFFDDVVNSVKNSLSADGASFVQNRTLWTLSNGTWSSSDIAIGTRFAAKKYITSPDPRIYEITGNADYDFVSDCSWQPVFCGTSFLNKSDNYIYVYNGTEFVKSNSSASSSTPAAAVNVPVFFTEAHSLTAAEATAKSFSLTHNIAQGQESNTLLFVSGLAQIVGTDFTASGNSISWNNKALDDIDLAAGDAFLIQYIKE